LEHAAAHDAPPFAAGAAHAPAAPHVLRFVNDVEKVDSSGRTESNQIVFIG
jgi:hypothetical protein